MIESRRAKDTEREHRLRLRLDELTDELEQAAARIADLEAQIAECRQARKRLSRRNWYLSHANELWRTRWAHRTRPG